MKLRHNDRIYDSPGYERLERKISRFQRKLTHQIKGSKRWKRTNHRIAQLHLNVANIRTDFLHKLSTKLVNENQGVCLGDLNGNEMERNRKLARAISHQDWGLLRVMCAAKAVMMYGQSFQLINRWKLTSQICSCCRFCCGKLNLSIHKLVYINCNAHHDRDENAAVHIKWSGVEQSQDLQNGRGASVSPQVEAVCVEASTRPVAIQLSLGR